MNTDRELMQQALEALTVYDGTNGESKRKRVLAALRERLAQPEQEPVAWRWTESNGQHWFDWRTDWTHHDRAKAMGFAIEYAYTSPPPRKPLPKAEWPKHPSPYHGDEYIGYGKTDFDDYATQVLAAHGITGEHK